MEKSAIWGTLVGAIGGAIAMLVGAGVLFPPIEWSPILTKSSTSKAEIKLSATKFDRDILIQVKAESIASRKKDSSMTIEINANGELCNIPNNAYKNPTTPSLIKTEDFCSLFLSKNEALNIKVDAPNRGADGNGVTVSIQTKNASRPLW